MKEIQITKENSGGRLDKLLLKYLDKASFGSIHKMLRKKNIVLNGKRATGSEQLKEGDCVRLYLSDETIVDLQSTDTKGLAAEAFDPERFAKLIVYEDDNIIALNKPRGLLSQKAKKGDISLNDMLITYLGSEETFTPGIANRLDRNTCGLILAGKNLCASRLLNEAIRDRSFEKRYLALVAGRVERGSSLKGYLVKDEKTNVSRVISADDLCANGMSVHENAKLIRMSYTPIATNDELSLIEADLITGRSHQIRAQMASAGHPLIGDSKYGDLAANRAAKEKYGLDSQLLCAYKIQFKAMKGQLSYLEGTTVLAPLPERYIQILKGEGLWQPGLQEA